MRIRSPKDFWAALMFIGLGLFFVAWSATHYQMGSTLRMGPGYFPAVLGGVLALLGVVILAGSLVLEGAKLPHMSLRPLFWVIASIVAYGYLMQPFGLVLSTFVLVSLSAIGGHEFRWREVGLLSLVLVLFSVLVFVKGLTLPFPLCPQAIDAQCTRALDFSERAPERPRRRSPP